MKHPCNKDFIFSIYDDTDVATLEYIKPIYDLLASLNIKTTKSVWPLSYKGKSQYSGSDTLANINYLKYLKKLQEKGFEISFHGARMVGSCRSDTIKALEKFKKEFGHFPKTYAAHSVNDENVYWGEHRFTNAITKYIYRILSKEKKTKYKGHVPKSSYFWGDILKNRIDYVRSFTFDEVNLLNISQKIAYKDLLKKYIPIYFITADADNVENFNKMISIRNQEKLEREKGICIISTHFGKGFNQNGQVHSRTKKLLVKLSNRNGWFVPVSQVLEHVTKNKRDVHVMNKTEMALLETKWLFHSIKRKIRKKNYIKTEIPFLQKNISY